MFGKPKQKDRRNVWKAKTTGKKECSESQNHRKEGMTRTTGIIPVDEI
jgi:hypothetical protein